VTRRPLPTRLHSEHQGAPQTGLHHLFCDVSDGQRGAAVMAHGLSEHEVLGPQDGRTVLALTLLRSVGGTAGSDSLADEPGPSAASAPELGPHRFEYALLLHEGTWEHGEVLQSALRYAAPPRTFTPGRHPRAERSRSLAELSPSSVILLAAYASDEGLVLRLLNAAPRRVSATVLPAFTPIQVSAIDPLEQPLQPTAGTPRVTLSGRKIQVALRPWEILTLLLRR
jgi:alpha-mannosidase